MQETLYFTDLVRRHVCDSTGRDLGAVTDVVISSGELFPRISGFVVRPRRGGPRLFVSASAVVENTASPLVLKPDAPAPAPLHLEEGDARLGHTFLDKQIVDTQDVRVVRVNDLKLALIQDELRLLGADVSVGGLLRRMHADRVFRRIAGPEKAEVAGSVIPWNFVDPLSADRVRLNVTRGRLKEMRPADLADVLEQLPAAARAGALADLTDEQIADTLSEARLDVQRSIIEQMEDERASDILERMAPDDATDLLQDLTQDRREDLLERMEVEEREEIAQLLQYPEDSAGGLMTTDVVRIPAEATAEEAIALLRKLSPDTETVYYLYIVDSVGRLDGVVSLRSLITAPVETLVHSLANTRVHHVNVLDDQEHVAEMMAHYNLLALPVLDDAGVLKGIITIDDVIDVLREEASEDLSMISSGSMAGHEPATVAGLAGRVAWFLAALLVTSGLGIVLFQHLDRFTTRAGWLPTLCLLPVLLEVGNALAFQMAAAIGRELDEERPEPARVIALEAATATTGAVVTVCLALGATLLWPGLPHAIALVLALALLLSFVFAELCGIGVPFLLQWTRRDPTWSLRPILILLVTTGSLAVYFGVLLLIR